LNVPAIAGLGKACEFISSVGAENIGKHEAALRRAFEEKIKNIKNIKVYGSENKCGICAFNIADLDCVEVAQILNDDFKICVRAGLHCAYLAHKTLKTQNRGLIRASFGFFNTQKDVDVLADAVYKLSKNV